jgi:hypothetical protein
MPNDGATVIAGSPVSPQRQKLGSTKLSQPDTKVVLTPVAKP